MKQILIIPVMTWLVLSLPARERGLKLPFAMDEEFGNWSLPARERGLKHGQVWIGYLVNPCRSPRGSEKCKEMGRFFFDMRKQKV